MVRIASLNKGLVVSTLTILLSIPPALAQIVRVRNIEVDVRLNSERVGNEWSEPLEQDGDLQSGEWIGTGGNSKAD